MKPLFTPFASFTRFYRGFRQKKPSSSALLEEGVEEDLPLPLSDERALALSDIDALLAVLAYEKAGQKLLALLENYSDDPEIVHRYFVLSVQVASDEDIHRAAALCFALPEDCHLLMHEAFSLYMRLARPYVRFVPSQLAHLVRVFAKHRHPNDAFHLLEALSRFAPNHAALKELSACVAASFKENGEAPTRLNHLQEQLLEGFSR